jgi:hypothetical protein
MRGCVWLGSTYIDAAMHRVPAGFALVPVTPGTDIVRGKPRVVEAEGSKRAPRKQTAAGAAAEVRRQQPRRARKGRCFCSAQP